MMKNQELKRSGIVSAGAFGIDYIKQVEEIPQPGRVTRILNEAVSNGGVAYNLLVDLARLGADWPLYAAGWIGNDVDGRFVQEDCQAHDIDIRWLRSSKELHSSYSDVMVCVESGERSILSRSGAHTKLKRSDMPLGMSNARIFHLGPVLGLGDLDRHHSRFGTEAACLLRSAQKAGMETAVSFIPVKELRNDALMALRYANYVFLHEGGLKFLSGLRLRDDSALGLDSLLEAVQILRREGVNADIILRLHEGAVYVPGVGGHTMVPRTFIPRKRMVSLNGVDSAFAAGVLYGIHENFETSEALKLGLGAYAACGMDLSTSGGVRTAGRCLEIYRQYRDMMIS